MTYYHAPRPGRLRRPGLRCWDLGLEVWVTCAVWPRWGVFGQLAGLRVEWELCVIYADETLARALGEIDGRIVLHRRLTREQARGLLVPSNEQPECPAGG